MPDLDGAAATRRIVAENPSARIVVLTSFGDRPRILEALKAGAVGYLLKDTEPEELLRAVRAAAAGDAPLDPRAARELLAARRDRDAIVELTERERQILTLVSRSEYAEATRPLQRVPRTRRHQRATGSWSSAIPPRCRAACGQRR